MTTLKVPITDAVELLYRRYINDNLEMQAMLEEEESNLELAQIIYDLREDAGLTHQQLADITGIDPDEIIRLEECDYEGNMLVKLRRIAAALHKKIHIDVVPNSDQ